MQHRPVKLPTDHLPHKAIVEWWYFNGHLEDAQGKRYAFMDCLFKVDIRKIDFPVFRKIPFREKTIPVPYVHFAHTALMDIARQKSHKDIQHLSLISADSFQRPGLYANYVNPLKLKDYVCAEIAETGPDSFHVKTDMADLHLVSRKPAVLHGDRGLVTICDRETYYYSLTDMEATGLVKTDKGWVEVKGKMWMDHQWADVPLGTDKWSWFSVQLDDGTDIMAVEYDDGEKKDYLASAMDKQGGVWQTKELTLTPGRDVWRSPQTKAKYPLTWEVEIPEKGIKLQVHSLIHNQEMVFGSINYWEGPLEVAGTVQGKPIRGQGFMELVGYPSDYNYLMLVSHEINQKIRRWIMGKGSLKV
jgi:predicted secreted hydrolase